MYMDYHMYGLNVQLGVKFYAAYMNVLSAKHILIEISSFKIFLKQNLNFFPVSRK